MSLLLSVSASVSFSMMETTLKASGLMGYHISIIWSLPCESHSAVSDSLQPHGLYSPWNSPGQNTGVDGHSFLQGIFLIQVLNPGLLHYRRIPYQEGWATREAIKPSRLFLYQKVIFVQKLFCLIFTFSCSKSFPYLPTGHPVLACDHLFLLMPC